MPFLRLAIVFAFFAFSIARAQLTDDFEVLANGVSKGSGSTIQVETVYGDNLILSVSPAIGIFEWISSSTLVTTGSSFSPEFILEGNPLTSILETYQVKRMEDGKSKTIIVTILTRPSFIVSFNTDGGTPIIIDPQTVLKDSLATEPAPPTKTGYNFVGWDFDFKTPITKSIMVNAKWEIKKFTVSFDSDGGSPIESQSVEYNSKASIPTSEPTKTGYDFVGWDFNFNTLITKDTEITAEWKIKIFTVSFNSNGGSELPSQNVEYKSTVRTPTPPTKANYEFDGWLLNGSKYNFGTLVTGNITLDANWILHPYSITYNIDGGTCASCPTSYTIESPLITLPVPTKTGYEFNGWFDISGTATSTIPAGSTGDKTFSAKWTIITYNITYIPNGGVPVPPPATYNVNSPTIPMPTFDERCGYKFAGWFENQDFSGTAVTAIPTGSIGNRTFYASWIYTPNTPTINMLSYSQPSTSSKIYDGKSVAPVTAVSTSACQMGAITILYNDAKIEPTNAGIYRVEASVEENEYYTAAKIPLGNLIISKASVTFSILATVSDKEYDATTAATIKSIYFTPTTTPYGDKLTTNDYSVSAKFDNPNAGTHNINLNVTWLNGPLFQNYNITTGTIAPISAIITKATNIVLEIKAENYELSDPNPHVVTINKSPYINNVRIEYKRDIDVNYSIQKPNRVGNWIVRATVEETPNYEGKTAEAHFVVTRGNATTVIHHINFSDSGFVYKSKLSGKLRRYYEAGNSLCKIKNTIVRITIVEPDIILCYKNMQIESSPKPDGLHYEIEKIFGKPGLDTLIYELFEPPYNDCKPNGKYYESDTILIETPVPFDTVVRQKWNNVLYVNNNYQRNGGYEFTDFEWFRIRNADTASISNLQFYSAGPSSSDTLNPNDTLKIVMHTADGIRISTCEGNAKIIEVPVQTPKPALKKQVLGIKEKSLNPGSKVYNLKGKLTKETPAGVYIVEE